MQLPHEVSATLFLARPAHLDIDRLHQVTAARLGTKPGAFRETSFRLAPLLTNGDVHLHVMARDLPMDSERFAAALASGLPELLLEDIDSSVARHRANVTVTVGLGPEPLPRGKAPAEQPTQQAFDRLLILCHAAATELARDCHPLALHWSQSDQMLSASRFSAMADMLFPLPLFLHPRPRREVHGGVEWLALDIAGAEHLIGRPLRTAPAPVGFAWMMERVYAFVAHLRATGKGLSPDQSFATSDKERFTVHHDPDGGMRLVLTELNGHPVHRSDSRHFFPAA